MTTTIKDLQVRLRNKETTSVKLTEAYLARIDEVDSRLNAFLCICAREALSAAKEADKLLAADAGGPLTGIPISVKDIFCTKDVPTTCASKILEGFVPPYDAFVVEKLKAAGAVILGKNNMDEFAMGSSTENSAFKTTVNPWGTDRVPGGSSGGSAVAVAAGESAASVGTDTGGSIRQPAALCGVVGLKPTYGRVSRYGMIAFASSLDQAGPITKSVEDAALMLKTIAGHDPRDSTSIDAEVPDFTATINDGVEGLKIGIPKEYFVKGIDPEVEKAIRTSLEVLKDKGAELVEISLPHTEYAVSVYYLVATAEASSNLARFDGVKYGLRIDEGTGLLDMYKNSREAGFGPEVKRRIMLGTYALSSGYYDAYYKKASQVRTLIKNDFEEAFKACDIIATPTAPGPAFKIGEKTGDPLTMYLSDIFTLPASLAGIPAISLPCGFTSEKLPIGLHLIGKSLDEETVLKTAKTYEDATEWNLESPEL